jgi:hypothetical protein
MNNQLKQEQKEIVEYVSQDIADNLCDELINYNFNSKVKSIVKKVINFHLKNSGIQIWEEPEDIDGPY